VKKGSVLIHVAGGLLEALCAEPAISAFAEGACGRGVTVCSRSADLYVGHPCIEGVAYSRADADNGCFEQVVELTAEAADPVGLMHAFAGQLGVTVERDRPRCYLTSMDRLRIGRFGLKGQRGIGVAVILPDGQAARPEIDTLAADIEERLGTAVIFVSGKKHGELEHGRNLTGRLMSREMMAVVARADCWIGFDRAAAAMGWAAGKQGIVLAEDTFESPDEQIRIRRSGCGRETLLAAVSELVANDSETV